VSYSWMTMEMDDHKVQEVEIYASLDEVIEAMGQTAWEDDSNKLVDWVCDEEKVVAVAIFGPEKELLVTCADGRQLRFEMPERYKE
jgi:hypothetical protein